MEKDRYLDISEERKNENEGERDRETPLCDCTYVPFMSNIEKMPFIRLLQSIQIHSGECKRDSNVSKKFQI